MSGIVDKIKATGTVSILVTGPNGEVKDQRKITNRVVTAGKEWIAARMYDTAIPTQMGYMAVGNNNTLDDVDQTSLIGQVGARVALTSTTVTNNQVAYEATFGSGDAQWNDALIEAGIFNDAIAGDMLARTIFSAINKGTDDTLTITWTITIN